MRNFKAALFDLDGTLIDTENQYTVIWGEICRRFRPDIPGLEIKIKGTTLTQILGRYFPEPEVQAELTRMLYAGEAGMTYEFYPGALEFISDIKHHGVKCAVVTSSNRQKMNAVRHAIPDFDNIFDRVLTAEDFSASKPSPDCYLLGAHVFGCKTDDCVVFEDALNGLQAGMASGIFTIGLPTGNPRDVIQDKCDYVLDGFVGLTYDKLVHIISERNGLDARH